MWQTPLARELLQRYCGTEAPTTPPAVLQWLDRLLPELHAPPVAGQPHREPPRLTLDQGPRRLTFRLHQRVGDEEGADAGEEALGQPGDWLIVMQETSDAAVLEALAQAFGLTAREAEVLYWVVKGKINRDIGDILGSSPATVKKHLERIHAKLGVETRTAARGHGDQPGAVAAGAGWGVRPHVCFRAMQRHFMPVAPRRRSAGRFE